MPNTTGAVTVHIEAPADEIWALVSDVTQIGEFSPETIGAQWLDGATGPALGARFRGHVNRNGWGIKYWTVCEVTACEPGREFGFEVLLGGRPVNNWHYELTPTATGTDVTESFTLADSPVIRVYVAVAGSPRRQANLRNMRKTLDGIKAVAEAS